MARDDLLDLHHSQLATWGVQTVGKAILVSALASAFFAAIAVVNDSGPGLAIAIAIGPIIFGAMLMNARAPMPLDVD